MAVLTKNATVLRRRTGGRAEMSHRPNHNIYHGMLPPESAHESQLSQPVEFTGPSDGSRFAHDDAPYMPRRANYALEDRHPMMMPPNMQPYSQQNFHVQSQSINMGGQGPMMDQQFHPSYPSPPMDHQYAVPPAGMPAPYHHRDNSLPYAFPGSDMPGGNRPHISHHPHSYPGPGFADLPTQYDDGSQQGGQPIPNPEEYLRQKLALRPGDPISLWSLPDPEPGQRPPHSYPLLVRLAIYGSPKKQLTLKQIYDAIEERFEYYRNQPKGAWKGSIRHNLSLNQVFKNVPRSLTEPGKGNYWEIDHSRGEGYKRDRKRKSRRTRTGDDPRSRSDEDDYAYADLSGCELEGGILDSDHSDGSGNHAGPSSSRISRRASPYQSPSAPVRRLEPGRYGPPSAGTIDPGSPMASQYYASSPEGSAYSGSSYDSAVGRREAR